MNLVQKAMANPPKTAGGPAPKKPGLRRMVEGPALEPDRSDMAKQAMDPRAHAQNITAALRGLF
jgi:hypothetical protein